MRYKEINSTTTGEHLRNGPVKPIEIPRKLFHELVECSFDEDKNLVALKWIDISQA